MRRAALFKLRHYLISGFIGQRLEWNPMAFMQLKVYPTDDKSSVTIELWQEGKPLGHILLAGSEAEGFCQSVAEARKKLADEVSVEIDPGSRLAALYDPMYATTVGHSQGEHGVLLLLRHPGLGWLPFLLPHTHAADLAQRLMDDAKRSTQEST
jgi:hypothetical protein